MAYERRNYQVEAIAECLEAFTARKRESVLLESPVGSGKTYMALEVIHRFQESLGRRLKVGWVAPRRLLLQQTMEANRDLYRDDIRPISLFERMPPVVDLVVLDEAHHEATQSCVILYEKMRAKWTLGLSATPLRTDRMKLSFQETVRTCSIARLIREGYLSPFRSYLVPNYTVDEVADFYLADVERWGKSLVYFSTIAECVAFKARLAKGGVGCEVVTGESDKDVQMAAFANGAVQVIANVAMLTEGFDQPDVMSIFARDASRLPTIQMCGRGLRRATGKTACNIVQSANSSYLFERVAPPLNAYRWQQGHWLALSDGTEEIERTLQETLRRMGDRQKQEESMRSRTVHRAVRATGERFRRKLDRLTRAEQAERDYYEQYGNIYDAIHRFCRDAYLACWGGDMPPVAIHLSKSLSIDRAKTGFLPNFVRDGDSLVPAVVVNLRNCVPPVGGRPVSPQRLGIEILRSLVRMQMERNPDMGRMEVDGVLLGLGFNVEENRYMRDSPFASVLQSATVYLPPVASMLRNALGNPFSATEKGDGRYYLDHHAPASVMV